MHKTIIICTALAISAGATAAVAGGGNSDNAKAMVDKIHTLGGNVAATIRPQSGGNSNPGDYGWGNAGSRLTTGTQVSKSGKPD